MIRRSFRIIAALSLLAAVSACQASDGSANAAGTHSMSIHGGDLRDYLIPVPDGATGRASAIGHNGLVTMAQDAAADGTPTKRLAALRRYGFQSEAIRDWATKAGDGEVILIRFSSAANALDYIADEQSYGADLTNWKIPQIAGGLVFTDPSFSSATTVQVEGLASEGDTAIIVFSDEPGPATPDLATTLTTDQFLLLAQPTGSPSA